MRYVDAIFLGKKVRCDFDYDAIAILAFFEVVVSVTSLLFFLSNDRCNVVTLKVTVAHH